MEQETVEELFQTCDLDNDGYIDREELKFAITKRTGKDVDDVTLDALMKVLGGEDEGRVSQDTFVRHFDVLSASLSPPGSEQTPAAASDATPSLEFNRASSPSAMSPDEAEEKMRWIFSYFDKDGDGVVTTDELQELLRGIRVSSGLELDDQAIDAFVRKLDKEDRGCIGFTQFFRAIKRIINHEAGDDEAGNNRAQSPTEEEKVPEAKPRRKYSVPIRVAPVVNLNEKLIPSSPTSTSFGAISSSGGVLGGAGALAGSGRDFTDHVSELQSQVDHYRRSVNLVKLEMEQYIARCDMLQTQFQEVKERNDKLHDENTKLRDAVVQNRKLMLKQEKIQKLNRELETTLETLKTEVTKLKDYCKDLQKSCSKLKLEKEQLNDELHEKRKQLQQADDKISELQEAASRPAPPPTLKKSLSLPHIPVDEILKLNEENKSLKAKLDQEAIKTNQMMKQLHEDNELLRSQLKEDGAIIENSNQVIAKLKLSLEEQSAATFNTDSSYKNSLLSELEYDVAVRMVPKIEEGSPHPMPIPPALRRARGFTTALVLNDSHSPHTVTPAQDIPGRRFSVAPPTPTSFSVSYMTDQISTSLGSSATFATSSGNSSRNSKEIRDKLRASLTLVSTEDRLAAEEIVLLEEMDTLEAKLTQLQEKHTALEQQFSDLQTEHDSLKQTHGSLNAEYETYKATTPTSSATTPAFPFPPSLTVTPVGDNTASSNATTASPSALEQINIALREDNMKLKSEVDKVVAELTLAQRSVRELSDSEDTLRTQLGALLGQVHPSAQGNEALNAENDRLREENHRLSLQVSKLTADLETIQHRSPQTNASENLRRKLEEEIANRVRFGDENNMLRDALHQAEDTIKKDASDMQTMTKQLRMVNAQLEAASVEGAQLQRQLDAAHAQIELQKRTIADTGEQLAAYKRRNSTAPTTTQPPNYQSLASSSSPITAPPTTSPLAAAPPPMVLPYVMSVPQERKEDTPLVRNDILARSESDEGVLVGKVIGPPPQNDGCCTIL